MMNHNYPLDSIQQGVNLQPAATVGMFPSVNNNLSSQYQSYEFDHNQNKFMEKTNYAARIQTLKTKDHMVNPDLERFLNNGQL